MLGVYGYTRLYTGQSRRQTNDRLPPQCAGPDRSKGAGGRVNENEMTSPLSTGETFYSHPARFDNTPSIVSSRHLECIPPHRARTKPASPDTRLNGLLLSTCHCCHPPLTSKMIGPVRLTTSSQRPCSPPLQRRPRRSVRGTYNPGVLHPWLSSFGSIPYCFFVASRSRWDRQFGVLGVDADRQRNKKTQMIIRSVRSITQLKRDTRWTGIQVTAHTHLT